MPPRDRVARPAAPRVREGAARTRRLLLDAWTHQPARDPLRGDERDRGPAEDHAEYPQEACPRQDTAVFVRPVGPCIGPDATRGQVAIERDEERDWWQNVHRQPPATLTCEGHQHV